MDAALPDPDQSLDWVNGTEEQIAGFLIDETTPATRDSTVLLAIDAATGGRGSDADRLAQIRRLIVGRNRARLVHGDGF